MRTSASLAAAFLAAVALLAGCASSFQGSYLVGERWFRTSIDTQPVIILGFDGRDTTRRRITDA